jgi:hypothetical protein
MSAIPPAADVLGPLQAAVLPGAGGAALVVCLFLPLGRWAGALGAALAVAVGFAWANYTFAAASWDDTGRLLPWKAEPTAPAWHWLPRVALVLLVVGLLSRWIGLIAERMLPEHRRWGAGLLVWAPRAAAVGVVNTWLATEKVTDLLGWPAVILSAVMLLQWAVLDGLARTDRGAEAAAYQSAALFAAGTVMLYAHFGKFAELGIALGGALAVVAIATAVGKLNASGAVPAGVAFLPGLVFAGRPSLPESAIPAASFWLVSLAPLALAPFLVPRLARQTGWMPCVARAVLVLTPLVIAVALAAQTEKLPWDVPPEEQW